MGTGITVLSVCYDDVLRVARETILRDAGYEVVSATHLSQALRLEDQAILTLATEELTPRPRVVEIYTYRPNPEISPDARVQSAEAPEALIRVMQNLAA